MNFFICFSILVTIYLILIVSLKGFSYKQILLLMLGGGLLLAILQPLYISIGKEAEVNLFFIKGNFQVTDFIESVKNYFPTGSGTIAIFFSLIIPAALEEFGKFFFYKKINKKLQVGKSITTTIIGILYVAAGFSFFETGAYIYFLQDKPLRDLIELTLARGTISTFSHILFSSIVGYYYGKAMFLKFQMVDNLEIGKATKWLKKFEKIPFLNIKTISRLYTIKYIATGFVFSILIHSIYNYFMETKQLIFAVMTVAIGVAIFYRVTQTRAHNKNYQDIKTKIAYLQEMKALKDKMRVQTLEHRVDNLKSLQSLKTEILK